jgi:hypothetical protein
MILLTSVVILSNMLIATVVTSISDDHCFDHDVDDSEDSFCYETQKECENERNSDLMAKGKRYKAIE